MRKLKQVVKLADAVEEHGAEILALDENGELWHGTLETSEDKRKVIDWTPVQLPPDGMAFSEPQMSFWDRMEKQAHDNYEASLDRR